jgi:hypothetical protein
MPTNAEKRKLLKAARERIRQRKVIIIPPKNDISLFQKQNCIERLPIPVFKMIQEYSGSEKDYRNLMNTNFSTFQPIKSETVRYSLLGPGMWTRMNRYNVDYKEASLLNIIKGVKDKSKQISLSFNCFQSAVTKYACLFKEIYKFHLVAPISNSRRFSEQLSFDIFNNIHHLTLERITGIHALPSDLRNVVKLELVNCEFIYSPEINPTKTLKELRIISLGYLNSPCSLDNISKVHIQCRSFAANTFELPKNCMNLELHRRHRVLLQPLDSRYDDNHLYEKLKCSGFSIENCISAFRILQRYPVIELENVSAEFPEFPVPHIREIHLHRFCLTSWNRGTITNLKQLI